MITDLVLGLFSAFAGWLASALPAVTPPALPGTQAVASAIAKADSLLPVAGLVQVAAGVLAAVVGFVAVRLVLMLRHTLLP